MANILVIDDSKLSRRILCKALRTAGHSIREACNGVEGLEAFRAEKPDCVLSDLLMPEMDGFEMVEAIRAEDQQTPIVVASADIQESSHQRVRELGVSELLTKPIKADELNAAIDRALATTEVAV